MDNHENARTTFCCNNETHSHTDTRTSGNIHNTKGQHRDCWYKNVCLGRGVGIQSFPRFGRRGKGKGWILSTGQPREGVSTTCENIYHMDVFLACYLFYFFLPPHVGVDMETGFAYSGSTAMDADIHGLHLRVKLNIWLWNGDRIWDTGGCGGLLNSSLGHFLSLRLPCSWAEHCFISRRKKTRRTWITSKAYTDIELQQHRHRSFCLLEHAYCSLYINCKIQSADTCCDCEFGPGLNEKDAISNPTSFEH